MSNYEKKYCSEGGVQYELFRFDDLDILVAL